jgi:DNA-binding NarL/FixJ family response regulator
MKIPFVLSRSSSYERHLALAVPGTDGPRIFKSMVELPGNTGGGRQIVLVHAPSYAGELSDLVPRLAKRPGLTLGIAADTPRLEEMLLLTQHGICAYFNSYMADIHYQQMLELLTSGQTWFAPDLLARALELAHRSIDTGPEERLLEQLTPRQREIALAVAKGLSNKKISTAFGITERTVKTHLTHIYRTLELEDRVALAINLSSHSHC